MADAACTVAEFHRRVEDELGLRLTKATAWAAVDIWGNWSAFAQGIAEGWITVDIDKPAFFRKFRHRAGYRTWKEIAPVSLALAAVCSLFSWLLAVAVAVTGTCVCLYARRAQEFETRQFNSNLRHGVAHATDEIRHRWMAILAAHYIAGAVELVSEDGRAHWPQVPSDVLTGRTRLVPNWERAELIEAIRVVQES